MRYKKDDDGVLLDDVTDTSIAIDDLLKDDDTAYSKSVWCYFEKGGIAAVDKWVEVGTGVMLSSKMFDLHLKSVKNISRNMLFALQCLITDRKHG